MKAGEILAKAIELLGPNGENWIQHEYASGDGQYCMVGALCRAAIGDEIELDACDDDKTSYNFERAKEDAETFGTEDGYYPINRELNKAGYILLEAVKSVNPNVSDIPEFNDRAVEGFDEVHEVMCSATKKALELEQKEENVNNTESESLGLNTTDEV